MDGRTNERTAEWTDERADIKTKDIVKKQKRGFDGASLRRQIDGQMFRRTNCAELMDACNLTNIANSALLRDDAMMLAMRRSMDVCLQF